MNGQIELSINNKSVTVIGGAYPRKPKGIAGVKLAEEIDAPCDVDLPIPDFSIPDSKQARTALAKAVGLLNKDKVIYVGCMGGFGRTGIFLSLLARLSARNTIRILMTTSEHEGVIGQDTSIRLSSPIEWVRNYYVPNAVETDEQYRFVMDFDLKLLATVSRFL